MAGFEVITEGSGKAHDPNAQFLSLGSLMGSEDSWTEFKTLWMDALEKHNAPKSPRGNRYLHSKEAMHNKGAYQDWDAARAFALIVDLMNALARPERADPLAISCSINLEDYRKSKARIPRLRPPEAIWLDLCFGLAIRHPSRDSGVELYFDRHETFYPILRKVWKQKANGRGI
jgi:hypothetical protein